MVVNPGTVCSFEIVGNETTREESGFDRASEFFWACFLRLIEWTLHVPLIISP
jgi:hypothetical protein